MFFKQFIGINLFFIAVLPLCIAQTPPKVEVDQVLFDDTPLTYFTTVTVFDNDLDSIELHTIAYKIADSSVNIPFITDGLPNKIKTGEQKRFNIKFNADSLAKYNVGEEDIAVKIVAHKPASETEIVNAVAAVDAKSLQQFMAEVEGARHATSNPAHYLYVQQLFDSLTAKANFKNLNYTYPFESKESKNLIAAKTGIVEDDATILITAHYDTVANSPGADDNGSGVCGLFMAMEILKNYDFENNIKIVGFDDEEAGLIGSTNYITNGIEPLEKIEAVFNFEMIGYASDEPNSQQLPLGFNLLFPEADSFVKENDSKGDFLICVGNTISADLIATYINAAAQYVPNFKVLALETPGNGVLTQDLRRSDHAPFWDNNYQALMLTDGANFRNPFYHTPNDIGAILDYDFMANTVKVTIAAVMHTAKPIVFNEANVFIKDAILVDTKDLEIANTINLAVFGLGNEKQVFYELPADINEATLTIYNLNGQFLENYELNLNKGRLSLRANYNLNQFAFFVIEIEEGIKYSRKIIMFP